MNRVVLIVINGHAGVGKDTFVRLCSKHTRANVLNYHRSDRAKTAMRVLGWNDDIGKPVNIRNMMKDMVNYMEELGTLNKDLFQQIKICSLRDRDQYIFYHVRDPKKISELTDLCVQKDIEVISMFITRKVENQEPDWWGDLKEFKYDFHIALPENDMQVTEQIAESFIGLIDRLSIKHKKEGEE